MPHESVILSSGGLDSTVLLAQAHAQNYHIHLLHITYPSRHSERETQAFMDIFNYYANNTPYERPFDFSIIELPENTFEFTQSSLLKTGEEIPHQPYPTTEAEPSSAIPGRNTIFLSYAIATALALKYDDVRMAPHKGDHEHWVYLDCTPAFYSAFQLVTNVLRPDRALRVVVPFINFTKAEVVKMGYQYNVPFDLTYSCYEGGPVHCGQCATCIDRHDAFLSAGVEDPTEYSHPAWR